MLLLLFIVYHYSLYQPFYFTNQSSELFYERVEWTGIWSQINLENGGLSQIKTTQCFRYANSKFLGKECSIYISSPLPNHLPQIILAPFFYGRNTYFLGHSFKVMVFMDWQKDKSQWYILNEYKTDWQLDSFFIHATNIYWTLYYLREKRPLYSQSFNPVEGGNVLHLQLEIQSLCSLLETLDTFSFIAPQHLVGVL